MTARIQNFKFYYPPHQQVEENTSPSSPSTVVDDQSFILVLIHGLNGNLMTWTPTLAPKLAEATGMRVLTYDQPCYGRNPLPFKNVDELDDDDDDEDENENQQQQQDPIEEMLEQLETIMKPNNLADELFKFLQAINVVPSPKNDPANTDVSPLRQVKQQVKRPFCHLFAQSFGGKTALSFADKYPFLVASITLGDIGICPCNKYDRKTAQALATQFYARHIESWPDEESVKKYVQAVFGGEGGDDVGKKYTFDHQSRSWVSLVRPHVGFIHDFYSRQADLRDSWADFERPVMAIRAGDEFTCLSDQEWRLMKDLRKEAQPETHAEMDKFVTPSSKGYHGVYRSHEDLFISLFAEFVKKASS